MFEFERGKIKTAPLTQRDRGKRKINGEIEWKMEIEKGVRQKEILCKSFIRSPLEM